MLEPVELSEIDLSRIPAHIAVIMDGNGRWAEQRDLARTKGHEAGELALFETVEAALAAGVKWLSVYAFSTENWRRPKDEVTFLLNFNRRVLRGRRDELNEKGVQIRRSGRIGWRVPRNVLNEFKAAEELTKNNDKLVLNIAFNYGGRAEIVDCVQNLIKSGADLSKVDEKQISQHMYNPDMPDPELMVRTSGETRISNFMMWQLAYSELVFTETLWPDFTRQHLWGAIAQFQGRNRRFGGLNNSK